MKTITISSSATTANIPLTAQDVQIVQTTSMPTKPPFQPSIGVVVSSSTYSVLIETRPVAADKALKTQRLNHALQLGYFPPLKETSSKLK